MAALASRSASISVQPCVGLALGRERHRVDDRRRARLPPARAPGVAARATRPPRSARQAGRSAVGPRRARCRAPRRAEYHHALGLGVGARAQQVAPVRRSELPGELELDEEEQPLGHRCTVSFFSRCREPRSLEHRRQERPCPTRACQELRERLADDEDRLGKALSDLLENSVLTGAIGRAFDAREKAAQAQEVAMGALNIPSAADIERLTRRLRSVSQRLEGIEDGVQRLDRALPWPREARLTAIEEISQTPVSDRRLSWATLTQRLGTGRRKRTAVGQGARRRRQDGPAASQAARRARPKPRKAKPQESLKARAREPRRSPQAADARRHQTLRLDRRARRRIVPSTRRLLRRLASMRRRVAVAAERVGDRQHAGHRHRCARPQPRTAWLPPSRSPALGARRCLGTAVVEQVDADDRPRAPPERCARSAPRSAAGSAARARRRPARARCRRRRSPRARSPARRARAGRARRRCRRGSRGARRARSARRGRSPPTGRPCRWTGSSAARRRLRRPV